jgi:hypothetical protein
MWVGRHSGLRSEDGKRFKPPPTLFPRNNKSVSREDLGLKPAAATAAAPSSGQAVDKSEWTVHCPKVKTMVKSKELEADIKDPVLRQMFGMCEELRTTSAHYGIPKKPLVAENIPFSKFPTFAVREMLKNKVVKPIAADSDMFSAVNGFLVDEAEKKRWRIITETLFNQTLDRDKLPSIGARSGREIHHMVTNDSLCMIFDFSCYYSSIELGDNKDCYVVRTKQPIEWEGAMYSYFVLQSCSMGSAVSSHIAVLHTLGVLEPLLRMEGLHVNTQIDDVLLSSNDPKTFVKAVKLFLKRCDKFGFTLNKREQYKETDAEIIAEGEKWSKGPSKFLGIMYEGATVCNSEKSVVKVTEAWELLQRAAVDKKVKRTRRHLASIMSLGAWMCYNLGIPLYLHQPVLSLFSKLESMAGSWDDEINTDNTMIEKLKPMMVKLIANVPVVPFKPTMPSQANSDYDILIQVDAAATGGGAVVAVNGRMFEVQEGWKQRIKHSAWAEPMAATNMVKWATSSIPAATYPLLPW